MVRPPHRQAKRDIPFVTLLPPAWSLALRTIRASLAEFHRLLPGDLCTCNHNHFSQQCAFCLAPSPDPHRERIGFLLGLSRAREQSGVADYLRHSTQLPAVVPADFAYPSHLKVGHAPPINVFQSPSWRRHIECHHFYYSRCAHVTSLSPSSLAAGSMIFPLHFKENNSTGSSISWKATQQNYFVVDNNFALIAVPYSFVANPEQLP